MLGVTVPDELKEELKNKTGGLLKENEKEIQLFCPYCDDAYRKPNPKWGHLYIGKENLLFYCHRCGAKGHLINLLKYLNINPQKYFDQKFLFLNFSSKFIVENSIQNKNYEKGDLSKINKNNPFLFLLKRENFLNEINYVIKRTHLKIPEIFPDYGVSIFERNKIHFFNKSFNDGKLFLRLIQFRNLDKNIKIRYKKFSDEKYFLIFKKINNELEITDLIISEGPFDNINLAGLFFPNYKERLLYIALTGSYYQRAVREFILKYPQIKKIHLFLDSDINEKRLYYRLKNEIDKIYSVIHFIHKKEIILYKNPIHKDYGEIDKFNYTEIFKIVI